MKLEIGMDSMLKLLREFINQTGFAVWEGIGGAQDKTESKEEPNKAWLLRRSRIGLERYDGMSRIRLIEKVREGAKNFW